MKLCGGRSVWTGLVMSKAAPQRRDHIPERRVLGAGAVRDAVGIVLPATPASYRPLGAAKMTGVSRPYISGAIGRGELKALRLGDGVVIIPREELQLWLDNYTVPWGTK